jgi:transcriptional regulator with AAA-type ATPase domain
MDETIELDDSVLEPRPPRPLAICWFSADARRGNPPEASEIDVAPTYQLLGGARGTVGRGPDVTISVNAAGVSRRHAEIYWQGPACVLHDLGSTNGSYVNGQRVEYAALLEGHVIRLGDAVGLVTRLPPGCAVRPDGTGAVGLIELAPGLVFGPGLTSQLAELGRVGSGRLPIVIVGETGSGKELVARAAHLLSGRPGALHAVNCAALPPALAEAELFGHARGAFTGAEQAGLGHVRASQGGTLFLDELPELPPPVQAKLLRVLQEREVMPLGDTRSVTVDLHVVAACQKPLPELVAAGKLRQDLAARLAGLIVDVPPLRARPLDVQLLFDHFLRQRTGGDAPAVAPRLLECLLLHDWPGNVRELELLTRRLLALHGHEPLLRRSHLPPEIRRAVPAVLEPAGATPVGRPRPGSAVGEGDRDDHDLRRLTAALRLNEGNLSRAAATAGISRARAYRLLGDRSVEELLAD